VNPLLREAVRITPDEAVTALESAAWTEQIREEKYVKAVEAALDLCEGAGMVEADSIVSVIRQELGTPRTIVHCFLGGLGADWDLEGAVKLVREAEKVGWVPNIFAHELGALKDGKLYCFEVRAPEGGGPDAA